MWKSGFSFAWQKYLSTFLIFCLLVSQTIRVDFFDVARANPEDYRDIVSIFVDEDTYDDLDNKIKQYAQDIEWYLWGTKVSIFVVEKDTPPAVIAAKNEKLYYEWDGDRWVSQLVGTVLIGDVPVPMVSHDGEFFPSMYPYVDFVEKEFTYNTISWRYESPVSSRSTHVEPEIWHGVINPAVWRQWQWDTDKEKISNFLDKTHDFYTQSGKFSPDTQPPRVFYYDGFLESRSVSMKDVFQYGLTMKNSENIAYSRFTKYLLKDITSAINVFDATYNADQNQLLQSLGLDPGQDSLEDSAMVNTPDIHTRTPILSLLKDFKSIINEKTLSDAFAYVHNAGRYTSGSTVRVDLSPVNMTLQDSIARSSLRELNSALMDSFDAALIARWYPKKIAIFDRIESSQNVPIPTATGGLKVYDNYFFGTKSTTITSPYQCTIARWSTWQTNEFGRDILVEANVGYDISSASGHIDMLKKDTDELVALHRSSSYACFDTAGKSKTQSYWGGNSILRLSWWDSSGLFAPPTTDMKLVGMSESIFSLGWMRESPRLTAPSPIDCTNTSYQYGLRAPYSYEYQFDDVNSTVTCKTWSPKEWTQSRGQCIDDIGSRTPRYSCLTEHELLVDVPRFSESLSAFKTRSCYAGTLKLDNTVIHTATNTCISQLGSGDSVYDEDTTLYENQSFHTVSSLMRHASPTAEEIDAATKNTMTPSLPIDTIRSVQFLTPKGNIARIAYPNFFTAPATDVPTLRAWLKSQSDAEWKKIIDAESSITLSEKDTQANTYLTTNPSLAPIDWNDFLSDEALQKIIEARNWLTPDVTKKYKSTIETALSYSHTYGDVRINPPKLPTLSENYEVAYLGLTPFEPRSTDTASTDSIQNDYALWIQKIEWINIASTLPQDDAYQASEQCGAPEGVDLFQWPQAILCWIKSLTPPRIIAWSCSSNTIWLSQSSLTPLSPPLAASADTRQTFDFYSGGKLTYAVPRLSLVPGESLEFTFQYTKNNSLLSLPQWSRMRLAILSGKDKAWKILSSDEIKNSLALNPESLSMSSESVGKFLLLAQRGRYGTFSLQATLDIALPDGTILTQRSDIISLEVTDQYLQVTPKIGDTPTAIIPVTTSTGVSFDFFVRDGSGNTLPVKYPVTLDLYDDITWGMVQSGIILRDPTSTLPESLTKSVTVYRGEFRDASGRSATTSIAFRSGPLVRALMSPVSSSVVRWATTLVSLRLVDRLGNSISPELHGVDIQVDGGYVIVASWEKKTSLHIDAMDADIPLLVGSDTPGNLKIQAKIDDTILTETELRVFDTVRVELIQWSVPRIGGWTLSWMSLRVTDIEGNPVVGFNSVATLDFPEGAGYIDKSILYIRDGISENFSYFPGTQAGTHSITASIPWVPQSTPITLTLEPWDPLYITHETSSGVVMFSLRDRYTNISPASLTGTLTLNTNPQQNIQFTNGKLSLPLLSGTYTLHVPSLAHNTISQKDTSGIYTATGIEYYTTYIAWQSEKFDFLPDYNARYTVLAGGAFLRESEDILYNTRPDESQSLAVTTLLDSPYSSHTDVYVWVWGAWWINESDVFLPSSSVSLENGYPTVSISNDVKKNLVARFAVRSAWARQSVCSYQSDVDECLDRTSKASLIRLITATGSLPQPILQDGVISLKKDTISLLSLSRDGKISLAPGVSLQADPELSESSLVLQIRSSSEILWYLQYQANTSLPVTLSDDILASSLVDWVLLDARGNGVSHFSDTVFQDRVSGYAVRSQSTQEVYDRYKNWPNTIDSLGMIDEVPWVGWRWTNTMLLQYAGGNTVWESTRWFHTFNLINLWDPVTHNSKKSPDTERDGLDRALGTMLSSPTGSPVRSFARDDLDADGYDDVLTFHDDGYLQLFLNIHDRFRSRGNIAYIPQARPDTMTLGDFHHDNYSDIIFLDHSGSLVLLENTERKFTQQSLSLGSWQVVPYNIMQFKVYDMDADMRDDIVYLTSAWELWVLYGWEGIGSFDKKILDSSLGVSLSSVPTRAWGAIFFAGVPQVPAWSLGVASSTSNTLDDTQLRAEVYYQHTYSVSAVSSFTIPVTASNLSSIDNFFATTLSWAENSSLWAKTDTYIKSEYAPIHGVSIEKRFENLTSSLLHPEDTVRATITIKNTTSTPIRWAKYLDTIPNIFDPTDTASYNLTLWWQTVTRDFSYVYSWDFDAEFSFIDIPAGDTLTLTYDMKALPASYGEMLVGKFEAWETGDDTYGDIGFKTSTTCGADMILWRSLASREYLRWTRSFGTAELPPELADRVADNDKNGVPDSIDSMSIADRQKTFDDMSQGTNFLPSSDPVKITRDPSNRIVDIGFDAQSAQALDTMTRNLVDGLNCGFGGGGCMSFPMNWAPLAPWSAPTVFGYPLSKLSTDTGIPVFGWLTCLPTPIPKPCGTAMCPATMWLPSVYPSTPFKYSKTSWEYGYPNFQACGTNGENGAWWSLGDDSKQNFIRMYVTPTLTLGVGAAICFDQANTKGRTPMLGAWPATKWWNCIVMTTSMPVCKDDGSLSDGDVRPFSWLGTMSDTWNAGSCTIKAHTTSKVEDTNLTNDIIDYLKSPDTRRINDLYTRLARRWSTPVTVGPVLQIGVPSSGATEVWVEVDTTKPLTVSNIVKLKNQRISAFPDFLMDWLTRQTTEVTTALFTPPQRQVIPPTSYGQNGNFDGTFSGFLESMKAGYSSQNLKNMETSAGKAYDTIVNTNKSSDALQKKTVSSSGASSDLGKWMQIQQKTFEQKQDALFANELKSITNNTAWWAASMRAAYKIIGKLPLISLSERTVPINIPWILPQELDRYTRALDAYSREWNDTLRDFCASDPTPECLAKKATLESSPFTTSLRQNLKTLEEYKNFPQKLQKYITWRQRYLAQILCNIETLNQISGGWLKDNGPRFRRWVELWVLIKWVAASWQPVLDIFVNMNAQCGVCHNQRYNAQQFKFKAISALIPSLPIIRFPRWPNIVLDLHDIRLGYHIAVPNFEPKLNPIRLPDLPSLTLPNSPTASLSLPNLDLLPPIPTLPDLPDLPSLPNIKLPNLPPPPKIPKIFGAVSAFLSIAQVFAKMKCYYEKTTLVPEWNVWDVIAQRTERQGTLPFDFLNKQFPNLTLPTVKNIKVATHVKYEEDSTFLTEFAQAAVTPINEFGADMQRDIPTKVGEDVTLNPQNLRIDADLKRDGSVDVQGFLQSVIARVEENRDIHLETEDFASYLLWELAQSGNSHIALAIEDQLRKAQAEEKKETELLLAYHASRTNVLIDYVQKKDRENALLQEIVDTLSDRSQKELGALSATPQMFVSEKTDENFVDNFHKTYFTETRIDTSSAPVNQSALALLDRAQRIALEGTSSSASSTESSSLYAPNFQWIYVLTEWWYQTRLFDYIEPLRWDERVDTVDIDKDGDKDYIYVMDGVLYVKRTHTFQARAIQDTSISVSALDASGRVPTAPNFFRQQFSTPNKLSLQFAPIDSVKEGIWRMEFFDRYMEWDLLDRWVHSEKTTPKRVIDFVRSNNVPLRDAPVERSLADVGDPTDIVLSWPKMSLLNPGAEFSLTAGKVIYTGDRSVTLAYTGSDGARATQILSPYRAYTFPETRTYTLDKGRLYIFAPSSSEQYTYTDEMIGMPILPGMRVYSLGGGFDIRDHIRDEEIGFAGGAEYLMQSVSTASDMYSTTLEYPNGFYLATLRSLSYPSSDTARVTLLAPQLSADTSAPQLDIPEVTRIPVYQQYAYSLRDFVSEINEYTLELDPDVSTDSDGNWVFDDDFASSGTGFVIDKNSISFGPYSTLWTKSMILKAEDIFWNTTIKPIIIQVYAPIPRIVSISGSGWIDWILDETLRREPIDVFRIRQWTDIQKISTGSIFTLFDGTFAAGSYFGSGWVVVSSSGSQVSLSERWVISSLPSGFSTRVTPSSSTTPLLVQVLNPEKIPVYEQLFTLPRDTKIVDITDASSLSWFSIGVSTMSPYRFVAANSLDPAIPWGWYVIDASYQSLLAISRDGNIYPLDPTVTLQYTSRDGYPLISASQSWKTISNFWYKFDFFYTVK